MSQRPNYFRVFLMFVRNSLVRDMMFPANFIIETISSFGWVMMNVGFYLLIFKYTSQIGSGERRWRLGQVPVFRVHRDEHVHQQHRADVLHDQCG